MGNLRAGRWVLRAVGLLVVGGLLILQYGTVNFSLYVEDAGSVPYVDFGSRRIPVSSTGNVPGAGSFDVRVTCGTHVVSWTRKGKRYAYRVRFRPEEVYMGITVEEPVFGVDGGAEIVP